MGGVDGILQLSCEAWQGAVWIAKNRGSYEVSNSSIKGPLDRVVVVGVVVVVVYSQ